MFNYPTNLKFSKIARLIKSVPEIAKEDWYILGSIAMCRSCVEAKICMTHLAETDSNIASKIDLLFTTMDINPQIEIILNSNV